MPSILGKAFQRPQPRQSTMISSRLPPSRLLGSVATTLCCPAFTCFVSTSQSLFVSAHWETAVFLVSPTNALETKAVVRFGYPTKLKQKGSEVLHDMFCKKVDSKGEAQNSLTDCLSSVIGELSENHVGWLTVPH
jgi:hypothetical protein